MSAIAGIFQMNGEPVSSEHSQGMMKSLEKYPADDVQTWQNGNVFLGCHAQWITPESVGEKLPYYDHERKLAITADAIIDNRDELFDKLNIEKHKRDQLTDSELILLAYYKWGEDSPKHLVGDFAYMIWDERKQKLFGARDFSGSRTLYYYNDGKRFAFCTVIHPFFTLPYIEKELNEEWLAEFLALPGIADWVSTSSSIYQNIKQLPPSHSISILNNKVQLTRYCHLNLNTKLKLKSTDEYAEAFREVFMLAVKEQTRTFRNVGARLSGGLDSGSVASFAARALSQQNKKLYSYSYIPLKDFNDWTPKSRIADERPYIKSTVEFVGNINDQYLDFPEKSAYSEIDDLIDILEMPYKFFENSYWMKGIYEKAYEDEMGVLLNGGRGNYTISWGPALDYFANLLKKMRLIRLHHEARQYSLMMRTGRKHILQLVGKRVFPILQGQRVNYQFPVLINRNFAKRTDIFEKISAHKYILDGYEERRRQFENVSSWDINGTSRAKFSLQYSLWDRDPTNDLRVVKFCLSVPDDQYVQNGMDRSLVRIATKGFLPDKVRLNQNIRGIQGADGIYRMKSSWEELMNEIGKLVSDPLISEFLNLETISDAKSVISEPKPENVYTDEFKILMRSIIVYRFIKKSYERG